MVVSINCSEVYILSRIFGFAGTISELVPSLLLYENVLAFMSYIGVLDAPIKKMGQEKKVN